MVGRETPCFFPINEIMANIPCMTAIALSVILAVVTLVVAALSRRVENAIKELGLRLGDVVAAKKTDKGTLWPLSTFSCGNGAAIPELTKATALRMLDVTEQLHQASLEKPPPPEKSIVIHKEGDEGGWRIIGTTDLPCFCAVGVYRSQLMVIFRGTTTLTELLHNDIGTQFIASDGSAEMQLLVKLGLPMPYPPQVPLTGEHGTDGDSSQEQPKVNKAFYFTYVGGIEDQVRQAVLKAMDRGLHGQKQIPSAIVVAGHSLGAGVACICAARLVAGQQRVIDPKLTPVHVVTTATPKPGNSAFRKMLRDTHVQCTCYANEADIVPWFPASVMPDLTQGKGKLEYVMPSGLYAFSYVAPSLEGCHTQAAYRAGINM